MDEMHELEVAETYRGVEISPLQSAEHVARRSKQIDHVIRMRAAPDLAAFAKDDTKAAEARF